MLDTSKTGLILDVLFAHEKNIEVILDEVALDKWSFVAGWSQIMGCFLWVLYVGIRACSP